MFTANLGVFFINLEWKQEKSLSVLSFRCAKVRTLGKL